MPCPFTGPKMFWADPNFLCQIKISFTYCGSHKYFVPDKKKGFAFSKIVFCADTKVFEEVLNAVKFLGWLQKCGPAQNILGPVKGQGISWDWHCTNFKKKKKMLSKNVRDFRGSADLVSTS